MEPIITVFGSSFPKPNDSEYKHAYEIGTLLAKHKYVLCNGGYGGTMEATHRGCKDAGGKTIGVTLKHFSHIQPNPWCDKNIEEDNLYNRINRLIILGQLYIVLKGSTGTLAELSIAWELLNKQFIKGKKIILVGSFWTPLIQLMLNEKNHFDNRLHTVMNPENHILQVHSHEELIGVVNSEMNQEV